MTNKGPIAQFASDFACRCIDIVFALTALALFGPLMLLISLAIVVESGRPILFSQPRLGKNGMIFSIYKFRKFRKEIGVQGLPLTMKNDDRMSRVGRFLMETKLDELPQLFNVLKGDMAIIGPRPESLAFADCFKDQAVNVLNYKPGILGPSQVAFRNEGALFPPNGCPSTFYRTVIFPRKASIDLAYYPSRTILSDIKWIVLGALAVAGIVPRTAEGLSHTADGVGGSQPTPLESSTLRLNSVPTRSTWFNWLIP